MTLHFFHRYDRISASFRARCECYESFLVQAGIPHLFHSLLNENYLARKYSHRRISLTGVLAAYLRRAWTLLRLRNSDVVIVHLELFPYLPGLFERFLVWKGVTLVYDFDDPFFHLYDLHNSRLVRLLFSDKIRRIIRRSTAVIAGNKYLEAYARKENSSVCIIPSVIDLDRYPATRKWPGSRETNFTIGWIGTPATSPQLGAVHRALRAFCQKRNVRVVLVGPGQVDLAGVPVEVCPWTEESEVASIMEFDVGIMPLFDTPFNRGKGGMKIIQYMACGIPAIVSPVGFNTEIVRHGENGFLASTEDEWVKYLSLLYDQRHLLPELGREARRTVEQEYCLQITGPAFVRFIKGIPQVAAC